MRKIFLLSVFITSSLILFAQENLSQVAFQADKKENKFPEDENGKIVLSGIVDCDLTRQTIHDNIHDWIYSYQKKYEASVSDLFDSENSGKVEFKTEIPIGKEYFSTPVGTFPRAASEVNCYILIEYMDNKFRYTLYDFYTQRRMIRGEAKSEGQSNVIHWQRVNSLYNEKKEYEGKKSKRALENLQEYEQIIMEETAQYDLEYNTVLSIIEDMKNSIKNKDVGF